MIFLGCFFDRKREEEYLNKSYSGLSNAANTFQWNCVDGLIENDADLKIINVLPVGTYPRQYSEKVLPSREWSYKNKKCFEIGCLNLPFIKQHQRYMECKKKLFSSEDREIIIYSAYEPFLKAAFKLNREYKISLIVTDLPEFYDYGKVNSLHKFLRKANNKKIYKYLSRVDKFILLTDAMKEPLNVGGRPYAVMEGINSSADIEPKSDGPEKIIYYAGTLNYKFGIKELLEAFRLIDNPDCRLWICGGGDAENEIKQLAGVDSRITFFGYVSKEKAIELQQQATVLVNPRQNNEEYTKYSFPSKTMEYLNSGIPMVGYKLDGIPDEYDEYINYVEDNEINSLAETINKVCFDKSGLYRAKAGKAQEYIRNEKNYKRQMAKMLNFING